VNAVCALRVFGRDIVRRTLAIPASTGTISVSPGYAVCRCLHALRPWEQGRPAWFPHLAKPLVFAKVVGLPSPVIYVWQGKPDHHGEAEFMRRNGGILLGLRRGVVEIIARIERGVRKNSNTDP